MNKELLFNEICKVKNFVTITPQIVSVGLVPVRPNFRKLISHPQVFRLILEAMAEKIKDLDFDLVAGGETAGIPWGVGLALITDKPFVYVRKAKVEGKARDLVEGDFKRGQKILLVDDVISKSETKKLFIQYLREVELKVNDILVIMNCTGPWFEADRQWISEAGINIHYLFTWKELAEAQKKRGVIPEEVYPYYLNFIEHPEEWQENKAKWQEYCRVLKHKLNIPISESLEEMLKMK